MHPERSPNADRSTEWLEARLRALPQPAVPEDLESRLLATIPADAVIVRRRWVMPAVWAGVAGPLAAACLLAVLNWPRRDGTDRGTRSRLDKSVQQSVAIARPKSTESANAQSARGAMPPKFDLGDDSASIAAWRETRRVLEGAEMPAFSWPLKAAPPTAASTSIPADLLE
jgi:hypothetical protein